MKLINITSSISSFRPVSFDKNFSIILGISKDKKDSKSHNLGKTTLIQIIDHLLFGSRDSDRIKAIKTAFNKPSFTLNIEQGNEQKTITVDYSKQKKPVLSKEERQRYEYFIRFQDDYKDEFRRISIRGKDSTWKPLLMRLLGFNDQPLIEKYEVEAAINTYQSFIDVAMGNELKILSRQSDIEKLIIRKCQIQESIDKLDLSPAEQNTSTELAENIDRDLLTCRKEIYKTKRELSEINEALAQHVFVDFSSDRIEKMYSEMSLYFSPHLKKDVGEVQSFLNQISINRTSALTFLKKQTTDKLASHEVNYATLNKKRTDYLRFMLSSSTLEIYRDLSKQLAQVEAELSLLQQDIYKESIQAAKAEQSTLRTRQLSLASSVAAEIDENSETFYKIKHEYSLIMQEVMGIDAELVIEKNSTGNINFKTVSWRNGQPSEELNGEMAKKISCSAFDVALRIVNNYDKGFIIHDGPVDNADRKTKARLIHAMKQRAETHDFQYILTAIQDDLPENIVQKDISILLSDDPESSLLMGKKY